MYNKMDNKIKPQDLVISQRRDAENTELEKILEGRGKLVNSATSREYVSMVMTGNDIKFFQDFDNFFATKLKKDKKSKYKQYEGARPIMESLVKNLQEIVIARASPENKFKIVKLLQGLGHVTGVTGSTFADSQVLKRADIGFATFGAPMITRACADVLIREVGEEKVSAERKLKGTSDKALADMSGGSKDKKHFGDPETPMTLRPPPKTSSEKELLCGLAAIVQAIELSRSMFDNMKKMTSFMIIGKVPQMMSYFFYIVLRSPELIDFTTFLILDWIVFTMPAYCILCERPEGKLLSQKPRNRRLERFAGRQMFFVSFINGFWHSSVLVTNFCVTMISQGFFSGPVFGE